MKMTREGAIRNFREHWASLAISGSYRTFMEIAQPESEFVFRARKADSLPHFALFEADGGAWRIEAMKRINAYLEEQLSGLENIVVLG